MANGLGRGLGSLIPNKTKPVPAEANAGDASSENTKDRVLRIDPEEIKVNPMQPRKAFNELQLDELIESIRIYGVIQPLIVTKSDSGFELIAGERRLRASKALALKSVPVIVRDANNHQKLELALVENIQRENLNPIELAQAYKQLIEEFNLTQEEVGKRVGKSRPAVANSLRFLSLPEEVQLALMSQKISEGHAKYIAGLEGEARQMSLFRKILHNSMTVDDTLKETKRMGGTKDARIKINYADKDKEFALREFFGAKIEIKRKGRGGQIIIDFYSDDELDGIISKVKR